MQKILHTKTYSIMKIFLFQLNFFSALDRQRKEKKVRDKKLKSNQDLKVEKRPQPQFPAPVLNSQSPASV